LQIKKSEELLQVQRFKLAGIAGKSYKLAEPKETPLATGSYSELENFTRGIK